MPNLLNISEVASLGLHAMAVLASRSEGHLTRQEITDALRVSGRELDRLTQPLAEARLLHSIGKPHGSFQLARPAHEITLLEIFEAIDGPLCKGAFSLEEPIFEGQDCTLSRVLQSIRRRLCDCLARTTLAELAQGAAIRNGETDWHAKHRAGNGRPA